MTYAPVRSSSHRSKGGFAIVTATVVLVALMALAVALSDTTVGSLRQSHARVTDTSLTLSAESIANLAFNHLQNLSNLSTELNLAKNRAATDDAAILTDEVETAAIVDGRSRLNGLEPRATWKWIGTMTVPIMGTREVQDMYVITATAAAGGPARLYNADGSQNPIEDVNRYRRRRVEALFIKFPQSIYRQAMFARKGYEFMGSATTDSWDSKHGASAYGTVASGANGDLASEGSIVVQKEENVKGDVNPNISMPIPPLTYSPPATAIKLPGPSKGTLTKTTAELASGSYVCTSIDIAVNNGITIAAGAAVDIYVDGPIILTKDWVIPVTSTVRIFQNDYDADLGQTTINGNITIGCPQNPKSFQLYSLYDGMDAEGEDPVPWDIKMNGTAQLGGVLFCPYASFKLNGTFDMFGSMIADSFRESTEMGKVNGNFKFHYDESLSDLELPFPPSLVVVGWRSYDLGFAEFTNPNEPNPALRVRYDDP